MNGLVILDNMDFLSTVVSILTSIDGQSFSESYGSQCCFFLDDSSDVFLFGVSPVGIFGVGLDGEPFGVGLDGVGLLGVGLLGVGLFGIGLNGEPFGVGLDGIGLDGVGLDGELFGVGILFLYWYPVAINRKPKWQILETLWRLTLL